MKLPEIGKSEFLEKKYLGKLSRKALNFVKELLKMDPCKRMTVDKAIQHNYFDNFKEKECQNTIRFNK